MRRPDELTFAPLGVSAKSANEPVDLRARQPPSAKLARGGISVVSSATRSICRAST